MPALRRKRLKALGNACVPQCAEVIGEIIQALRHAMPLPPPMVARARQMSLFELGM